VFRSRLAPAATALAAIVSVGLSGCSGGRSLIPGTGGIPFAGLGPSHPGMFSRIKRNPPVGMQLAWLMTDGTVLAQSYAGNTFYKYTPDSSGSYSNGTWAQVGSLQAGYAPDAGSSVVLADGRFLFMGGEYNSPGNYDLQLVNLGAIYDPVKGTWTKMGHPKGWKWIGDSPITVLADGRVLLGDKLHPWDATLTPSKSLKWKKVSNKGKSDWNAEEGWTLLADGTVLTADVLNAPNSEIYNPVNSTWKTAGSTIVDLHSPSPFHQCLTYGPKPQDCYLPPGEIGPSMLRPDGTVLWTGSGSGPSGYGVGHNSVYHSTGSLAGTWTKGPDFPNGDNAGDSFAVLEPSGNVLVFGVSGSMYEWNGTAYSNVGSWAGSPILLPNGQVMMFGYSNTVLYTPSGSPQSGWAPTITNVGSSLTHGQTYKITGTQFNGLSQALAFGDEYQNATNYPLVRITNKASGHVFYARTHDHSSMGVATGSASVSTMFDVPSNIETGASNLVVVANGIPSQPTKVTIY